MGDLRKGQCCRKGCRESAHRFGMCMRHRREEQERLEAIDARIMASIGRHDPDDDELDDDSDLEGESFDDTQLERPEPESPPPEEPIEEPPMNEKRCSRTGCDKPLRSHNSKGVCATKCNSPDAPPSHRADGVIDVPVTRKKFPEAVELEAPKVELRDELADGPKPTTKPLRARVNDKSPSVVLQRFRLLGETLGFDADELLADFAQSFIDRAKRAVTAPKLALVGEERQVSELVAAAQTPATPPLSGSTEG